MKTFIIKNLLNKLWQIHTIEYQVTTKIMTKTSDSEYRNMYMPFKVKNQISKKYLLHIKVFVQEIISVCMGRYVQQNVDSHYFQVCVCT